MLPIRSWVCRTVSAMTLVGSAATLASAGDSAGVQYYAVKEAQITYALSGMRVGTKSLAFTDYGSRTRQEIHATTTVMGIAQQDDSIVYTDGAWIYTLDPKTKRATKQHNALAKDFTKESNREKILKTPDDYVRALGGEKVGIDKLIGYACDIWDIKSFSTKTCLTKEGVALWTEAKIGAMVVKETATEVKIGSLPSGFVSLPPGITVVETEDPLEKLRQMRGQTGDRPMKKKKGKPLTPEEMQEAEKMREVFQGKDTSQIQAQIRKMQEQLKPGARPGQ
ncbi:MAG: hypothetical protein HXY51_12715 [Nitrospirae bacterium]|nr:hypothetical protein [Nitrospirota bacterium]